MNVLGNDEDIDVMYITTYVLSLHTPHSSYTGEISNNLFDGLGEYRWPNGDVYRGDYSQGRRNGRGEMRYADGDRYEGGWRDGKYHGKGEYR